MMRLVVALAASLIASLASAQPATLDYRVTYRDFLPAECMFESEYKAAWAWTTRAYNGVKDSWVNETDLNTASPGSFSPSQFNPTYHLRTTYCPYWEQMRNGLVKGHPDFEARGEAPDGYVDGPACTIGCTSTSIFAVVLPTMELKPSGLRKPIYCNRTDPEARCGLSQATTGSAVGRYTTSRAKYFESWFNDDVVYNRRVGETLTLTESMSTPGEFVFDSNLPSGVFDPKFAPLNATILESDYPYDEVPQWPHSLRGLPVDVGNKRRYGDEKYWYTTEIHTYFEFRGDETFEFSGDDDVAVYINGILCVDLMGLHSPRTGSVDLSGAVMQAYLNISVGNIYAFDLFQAERHTGGSNFKTTTTLASSCNVVRSGSPALTWSALSAADWKLGRSSSFNATTGELILTSADSLSYAASHAFLRQQVNVGTGFIAVFTVSLSKTGNSEGFAFVLHDRPDGLKNLPMSTGANLGFRSYSRSATIAFDLCRDRFSGSGDCKSQRVAVHYADALGDFNDASNSTLRFYDPVPRTLKRDDETHEIRIEYLETPNWLEVYIDNSLYLRDEDFQLESILGGRNAYVGFTTATSGAPSPLRVLDMTLEAVSVDPAKTIDKSFASANVSEPKLSLADGGLSDGFAVRMRDFCENNITYGGDARLLKGVFVELLEPVPDPTEGDAGRRVLQASTYADGSTTPKVLNATIVDTSDGTYAAALSSSVPGTFALYLCVGEACEVNVALDGDENSTDARNATVTYANEEFSASVARAVRVLPLTARPTTSPTVSAPTQAADTESAVLASSIGGGSALFALLLVGLILFVLRRRWQRDRAFIEDGALYNMEREVTYDKNDEYSTIGRMVMNTTAAIQRERAQKAGGATGVDALAAENEELQEQVRINKQKQQEAKQAAAARSVFNRGAKKAVKKKEFQVTAPNL